MAPGAILGEAFLFRVPAAEWFARALCAEGIDARHLGSDDDRNVRAFWNWRFLFDADTAATQALLPNTTRYLCETVDVPLSSCLTPEDYAQLVTAVRKVAAAASRERAEPTGQMTRQR
jgi:hypothetical protein